MGGGEITPTIAPAVFLETFLDHRAGGAEAEQGSSLSSRDREQSLRTWKSGGGVLERQKLHRERSPAICSRGTFEPLVEY